MAILRPHKSWSGRAPAPRRLAKTGSGEPRGRAGLPVKRFPGATWRLPHYWRRRILFSLAALVLTGVIGAVGVVAWVSQDLPNPDRLVGRAVAQSTKIYARDGETLLYDIHGEERRTLIELKNIGQYTKPAVLAVEDKDFYKHGGISLRRTIAAILVDITSGTKAQGGSTITQQLVKNAILTKEKSYIRKIKEWILAYQIERRFTKDQILKMYFNEIPFGSNAYGIEAAAQTYFNKHAVGLDLAESALLAAALPAPSYYSPRGNHPDELLQRWKMVLDLMVKQKFITTAQSEAAKQIDILARVSPAKDRVTAPHFVFYVRDYLESKYGTALLERGGLRVVTTLDPELQTIAEEEVAAGATKNERYGASNAALVAVEPSSGQLLAMVGSRDFFDAAHDGNFNVATAVRNPGSSFKPIVYLTAFSRGYTPETILFDLKTSFGPDGSGKDFSPNNYDFKEHGPLTMRQTLAGSLNIPAVKTLYLAGISHTIDVAEKLGYSTFDRAELGLALAIGGGGVKLIEHVSAFATLANDGVRNPTTALLRVENSEGKVLEIYEQKKARVMAEQPVRQLVSIMSDNNARAFIFGSRSYLVLPDRPVAAKTGTTNDFIDGWTVGFTPQLAAGVWVGNNDNSPMNSGADGVVVAAPIWNAFMRRAQAGDQVRGFTAPGTNNADRPVLRGQLAGETPIKVDTETGKQIPASCLATWPTEYVKDAAVREVHNILHYVQPDDPRGDAPADPSSDPMYTRWESPVRAWATKNGYVATAPAFEKCSLRGGNGEVAIAITSPPSGATVTSATLAVKVRVTATTGVKSVVYYLDDARVAASAKSPYGATIALAEVANGISVLRVVLTDAAGTTAEAEIYVNILSDQSAPTLYFISPSPGAAISAADFPQQIKFYVYEPAGIDRVVLFQKNPDGAAVEVDVIDAPANGTIAISWPTTAPGAYQLYFVVEDKNGQTHQSDALGVTVI